MIRWSRKKKTSSHADRPGVVTAIALTQFAKAAVILMATWLVWQRPGAAFGSGLILRLSDILTTGRGGLDFMAPVFAGYALSVGCGLWFLEKWARRTLMVTSGLTAGVWIFALVTQYDSAGGLADRLSVPYYDPRTLYTIVLIDAAVFLYLAFGRDVPEAFHHLDPPHV